MPLPFYDDPTAKASKNPKVAAQSELHALPNGQFLVLARDSGFGRGQDDPLSVYRHIDVFDVSGATDVAGDAYDCETCAVADDGGGLDAGVTAATYCSFLDFNVNAQLGRFGVHNGGDQDSALLVSGPLEPQKLASRGSFPAAGDTRPRLASEKTNVRLTISPSTEREVGVDRPRASRSRGPRLKLLRHQSL